MRFTHNNMFPLFHHRLIPRLLVIIFFQNLLLLVVLVPSFLSRGVVVIAKSLTANDMDLILQAASLSNRVYLWDDIGFNDAFETYYESEDQVDAVVVAVYPNDNKCIVAFRGTKPLKENVASGIVADITTAGIIDFLTNVALQKEDVVSKTDPSKSCTVGRPMLQSYYNLLDVEDQIDAECVSRGLSLIFTGHSQGAALAQLAAVRYEQQQPRVINFGPMAAFFDDDECTTVVPDERIINFVNTETDKVKLNRNTQAVQFDIVPFLDVFIDKYLYLFGNAQSTSDFFIGTFKGEFYILNPNDLPSLAYVPRRADILLEAAGEGDSSSMIVDVDLMDLDELLNFSSTTYGQRFASAHEMNNYQRKLEQLMLYHDDEKTNPEATNTATATTTTARGDVVVVAANGFESFTWCNPNAGWKQCAGFCAESALMCTTGAQGEPCSNQLDCVDGLSCTWTLEGIIRLAWRCL
jgi:pimeloyl-ACP methyl ester carboxylesterase